MLNAFIANLPPPARHATELDRLVAAAVRAHVASRRALAAALAEEAGETRRREALAARAKDLETRAVAVLAEVEAEQAEADAVRVAVAPDATAPTDDLAEAGFGAPTHVRHRRDDAPARPRDAAGADRPLLTSSRGGRTSSPRG